MGVGFVPQDTDPHPPSSYHHVPPRSHVVRNWLTYKRGREECVIAPGREEVQSNFCPKECNSTHLAIFPSRERFPQRPDTRDLQGSSYKGTSRSNQQVGTVRPTGVVEIVSLRPVTENRTSSRPPVFPYSPSPLPRFSLRFLSLFHVQTFVRVVQITNFSHLRKFHHLQICLSLLISYQLKWPLKM